LLCWSLSLSVIVLGAMFKQLLVDPMLKHGVLPLAMATMALTILMKEAVKEFYSAEAYPFPSLLPDAHITILGSNVSLQHIGIIAVAMLALWALTLLLDKTSLGRQMQATAQNPTVARILGIPVERMILYTFLINAVRWWRWPRCWSRRSISPNSRRRDAGHGGLHRGDRRRLQPAQGRGGRRLLLGVLDNLAAGYVSTPIAGRCRCSC
jgi:branched-chain amino acid transport system permease protein